MNVAIKKIETSIQLRTCLLSKISSFNLKILYRRNIGKLRSWSSRPLSTSRTGWLASLDGEVRRSHLSRCDRVHPIILTPDAIHHKTRTYRCPASSLYDATSIHQQRTLPANMSHTCFSICMTTLHMCHQTTSCDAYVSLACGFSSDACTVVSCAFAFAAAS